MRWYRIKYYYFASGMDHADERDFGRFRAGSAQEAIEQAIMREYPTDVMYGPDNSYSSRDFLRSCLSIKEESFARRRR